jgi:hypothetical protein
MLHGCLPMAISKLPELEGAAGLVVVFVEDEGTV